jgi:branched-chain amino acid transport system substrate-binding protein
MKRIATVLALLCAGAATGPAAELTTIKIASISPLSGPQAAIGEMIKLGAQLAIEQAQERFGELGYRIEFSPQDDQATPDVGVAVARRLVNDPAVLAVIGHYNSGVAIPASEVFKDYQLAMVSPANTHPKVTDRNYANVSRICGRDDVQGPVGAEFAVKELGARRIFVVHDKTAYGQGVADDFRKKAEALGARIAGFVGTEEKSNFQAVILQIKVIKPDLIYFGGIYDQGGVFLKQLRDKGITAHFMAPDGIDSSEFVKIAQAAADGAYYTTVAGPADVFPEAQAFADKFRAKFKKPAESYSLYAYDTANVVLAALEGLIRVHHDHPPTREEVVRAIRTVKWSGLTGHIEFDGKGDRAVSDYYVLQFQGAKYPGVMRKVISVAAPPLP